jgi:hypothetical protein
VGIAGRTLIDWQVQIDGQFPPGWDPHRDGCWFPDFDHQEYLLPYFDVGDSPLDPYGATVFGEADMRRLREHLSCLRGTFEAKPTVWTVTESFADQSRRMVLDRDRVLAVVDKTLEMIEFALPRRGTLVFRGD